MYQAPPQADQWESAINAMGEQIRAAYRTVFTDLAEGLDKPVGFGLYTDSDASTLVAAVESAEHLARMQAAEPALALHYQWTPEEWVRNQTTLLEAGEPNPFAGFMDRIVALGRGLHDADRLFFASLVMTCLVDRLAELVDEGFFTAYGDPVVVFAVSDDEDPDDLEEWLPQLNPDGRADAYLAWLRE